MVRELDFVCDSEGVLTMYIPDHFKNDDTGSMLAHIKKDAFGSLTTCTPDGPFTTHIPVLHVSDDTEYGKIIGHMASENDQTNHFDYGTALAVFLGPHAYISPNYYKSGTGVPTWNYIAVHAYGALREVKGEEKLRQQVLMTEYFERAFETPWTISAFPEKAIEQMLDALISFEMRVERLEGKWKLSQNVFEEDRQGVKEAFDSSSCQQEQAVGKMIE